MILALALAVLWAQTPTQSVDSRVESTLQQMSLDEKLQFISSSDGYYVNGLARLGLPRLVMSDGPVGVRNFGPTTAYPATVGLAATFDPDLAERFGLAIGRDARARGVAIWFAPGVNLSHIPQNGRNFEYLGEDPYLASRMVVPIVKGVQSKQVVAVVKHFAANNHEVQRGVDSSEVDERTLRELYFKAFEAAVKEGGALAVMCAYNKVNGVYCSENDFLLNQVLKKEWGFKGVLMSDYGATHSTLPALKAGLDLELPAYWTTPEKVKPLVESGQLPLSVIDDKVRRLLRLYYAMELTERPQEDGAIPKDDPANEQVALQIAREGTALLKNRGGLLPADSRKVRNILVLGPNATPAVTGGGGSSYTTPAEALSLLDAIRQQAAGRTRITYLPVPMDYLEVGRRFKGFFLPDKTNEPGLLEQRFDNMRFSGTPVESHVQAVNVHYGEDGPYHFSIRWTARVKFPTSGQYVAASRSDDGIRVYLDGERIIDDWGTHGPRDDTAAITVVKGQIHNLRIDYFQDGGSAVAQFGFAPAGLDLAKELPAKEVRSADMVVAGVGFNPSNEAEAVDRTFALPPPQDQLLRYLTRMNPRTVVVNNSGAGVDMSAWASKAGAIIQAWYPGGIGNRAVAEILFGVTNPTGKLPTTFPVSIKGTYYDRDYPPVDHKVLYREGLFMGYRWFDANHVAPLFPFGFGLSYTTFKLTSFKLRLDRHARLAYATVTVRNTGLRAGAEVVQAYVHVGRSKVVRVPKELKGFKRVELTPGQAETVTLPIKLADLAYYDVKGHRWVVERTRYEVLLGTSSKDLPLSSSFRL